MLERLSGIGFRIGEIYHKIPEFCLECYGLCRLATCIQKLQEVQKVVPLSSSTVDALNPALP